jgi:hypothetical protein
VKESSKKKDMPRRSQDVRNHNKKNTKNDISWYLPSPSTLSSSFSTADKLLLAGSSSYLDNSSDSFCINN